MYISPGSFPKKGNLGIRDIKSPIKKITMPNIIKNLPKLKKSPIVSFID